MISLLNKFLAILLGSMEVSSCIWTQNWFSLGFNVKLSRICVGAAPTLKIMSGSYKSSLEVNINKKFDKTSVDFEMSTFFSNLEMKYYAKHGVNPTGLYQLPLYI